MHVLTDKVGLTGSLTLYVGSPGQAAAGGNYSFYSLQSAGVTDVNYYAL